MAVSGGLYGIDSGLAVYVGASGVLHGLAAAAAVYQLSHGCLEAGWLLGGLVLKLGWEQYSGPTPGVAAWVGGPVVVNAHLYGTLGGLVWSLLEYSQAGMQWLLRRTSR